MKPVPVRVTTVPTGAPTVKGVCDVITGPATVRAAGNVLLTAAVLVTDAPNVPAVDMV
jgi:hypothetical protein